MNRTAFLFSDASYNQYTEEAGIGVVDMFNHERHADTVQCSSLMEAEWIALLSAIEIAAKKKYKYVVFVYDCKSLNTDQLKGFFASMFVSIQFLWLQRHYLHRADLLAREARPVYGTKLRKEEHPMSKELKKLRDMSNHEILQRLLASTGLPERVREVVIGLSLMDLHLKKREIVPKREINWLRLVYDLITGEEKALLIRKLRIAMPKKIYRRITMPRRKDTYYPLVGKIVSQSA